MRTFATYFSMALVDMVLSAPRPSAPFKALEGLDVDIEARSFFAIREYIFKKHSSRIAGLQRPESHLVRGKAIECSNAFDPAFANTDTGAH
jgi:hypothetical protein